MMEDNNGVNNTNHENIEAVSTFGNDFNNTGSKQLTIDLNMPFLKNLAGWATFVAVMDIIIGALSCLSFIFVLPAVFGVFKIISGVKLLNAADDLKRHISKKEIKKLKNALYNFNKYFKFSGISIIIQIVSIIVIIVLYIILIVAVLSNPGFFENIQEFPYHGYF